MTTPAPPSREAEIAARLAHAAEKWGDYHGDAEADCRHLLAQLQQANERERLALLENERLRQLEASMNADWTALRGELQQARQESDEATDALISVLNDEPVSNGEYVHALPCSAGRQHPIGTKGVSCSCGIGRRIRAAEAALQQAREALATYGKHQFQCAYMEQGDCDCTCGLDAALKAGR